MIFVEAGTWGYTALGGTIQLTRAAAEGTPGAVEAMPMGTEVILTGGATICDHAGGILMRISVRLQGTPPRTAATRVIEVAGS